MSKALPSAVYLWLVPSEQELEQPGSWRIRKWDTEPFPEANFIASAARRISTIQHVKQEDANGCIVASLAMITGKSYAEVRADHIFSKLKDDAAGCSFREVEEYLWRHGFAWQEVYRCGPPGNTNKEVWPPAPWADVHICEVQTGQAHSVVLLGSGVVLDPLTDEPKRLTDYAQVYSVRAVYPVPTSLASSTTESIDPEALRLAREFLADEHKRDAAIRAVEYSVGPKTAAALREAVIVSRELVRIASASRRAPEAVSQYVLDAVEAEPEVPGEMPDAMWETIRNDRDACTNAIRIAVRQTKRGIRDRLLHGQDHRADRAT